MEWKTVTSEPGCRICLTPRVHGVGGMVSFRRKLARGLEARGIGVCDEPSEPGYAALLVIGGTRRFWELRRARQRGIPVVQRLDGMNWLHRRSGPWRGLRHYLRAEYGNLVLRLIRSRLATHVIYQSEFVRGWWERTQGSTTVPSTVIYNGVDLQIYTPHGPETPPDGCWRILLVEGSLMGGYEGGLETAVDLAARLARRASDTGRPVELRVAGRVPQTLRESGERRLQQAAPAARLEWAGVVPVEQIPALDRSAHLLYSADINAACPNSAIEALACGLPVVGFATGALPELVQGDSGRLANYGGDPWKLDPPDVDGLSRLAAEALAGGERFRQAARLRAEAEFGLDRMVDRYLDVLLGRAH
jgi:glycosyltransferase involved in cell wall biosynthesis